LLLELEDSQTWEIEPLNASVCSKESAGNFNFVKEKIQQLAIKNRFKSVLTLNNECKSASANSQLKLEIAGNLYEFYLQLDTKELHFYRELNNLYKSSEILEPAMIRSKIIISYCPYSLYNTSNVDTSSTSSSTNLNNFKKQHLLDRIKVNFVLGFARVRTNGKIESVDFEILKNNENIEETKLRELKTKANLKCSNKLKADRDIDRTLTFMDEEHVSHQENIDKYDLERSIPLSNSGNVDVRVSCYFTYENDKDRFDLLDEIKFKEGYQLRLAESFLTLEKSCQNKQFTKLVLSKYETNETSEYTIENSKIFMIVKLNPNGFKFGIPVTFSKESLPLARISSNTISDETTQAINERYLI